MLFLSSTGDFYRPDPCPHRDFSLTGQVDLHTITQIIFQLQSTDSKDYESITGYLTELGKLGSASLEGRLFHRGRSTTKGYEVGRATIQPGSERTCGWAGAERKQGGQEVGHRPCHMATWDLWATAGHLGGHMQG